MAAFTDAVNGTVDKNTLLTEVAAKAQDETKVMAKSMLDIADKMSENGQLMLEVQQKLFENSFGLWKQGSQFYINFGVDVTQQTLDQLMALRERLGIIFENELKRLHELLTSEQKLTLDAAEVFQAQVKVASDQVTEMFTPPSLK